MSRPGHADSPDSPATRRVMFPTFIGILGESIIAPVVLPDGTRVTNCRPICICIYIIPFCDAVSNTRNSLWQQVETKFLIFSYEIFSYFILLQECFKSKDVD